MEDSPSFGRSSTTSQMTPLAEDFEPSADDVICGRGKKCYNHIGNELFRKRVLTFLDEYSQSRSKLDKSGVLSKVVDEVRQHSPGGGFVKQDTNGKWHEVGDFLAREKTSQAFRDALHERYKSSNISKKKRRQEEQAKASSNFHKIVRSEYEISSRLERLSNEVIGSHDTLERFNRNNYEMLSRINSANNYPTRRYSISREYRPRIENPGVHFPDPLFGSSINAANAMPSDCGGAKLSPHPSDGDYRSAKYVHSVGQREPGHSAQDTVGAFHHSLPEMVFSGDPFQEEETRMHHSMPNLDYSKEAQDREDRKPRARDFVEPIPLQHINIPGREKSIADPPSKKHSAVTGESAAIPALPEAKAIAAGPGRRISKDLMECLDKMTYHSINDDNPYEPIPLTPQQEKAHKGKILAAKASGLPQRNPLDESERDEFAEG